MTEWTELDTVLQMWPHQGRGQGEDLSHELLATLLQMHPRNPSYSLATGTQSPPEHFQTWKSKQRSLWQHTVYEMGYCDYLNCA